MARTSYHEPAVILQHPRAPVQLQDPRVQPVTPSADSFTVPTYHDWQVLDGCEAVGRLVDTFGAARVARWVLFQASIKGQSVNLDRPADRCLADGAVLTSTQFCVQCGRDNR